MVVSFIFLTFVAMSKTEYIEKIMSEVLIEHIPLHKVGGQQVNWYTHRIKISHPDVDFSIELGEARSTTKNIELGKILYKLGLEDLIPN